MYYFKKNGFVFDLNDQKPKRKVLLHHCKGFTEKTVGGKKGNWCSPNVHKVGQKSTETSVVSDETLLSLHDQAQTV